MSSVTMSPGTIVDDATVGTIAWSNPNNAKVSDGVFTRSMGYPGPTEYLMASNFGFTIPIEATINGILVEVERKRSGITGSCRDTYVQIIKSDGAIGSENKADTANEWVTTTMYAPYGSSSDLWSESWVPNDINSTYFGVVFAINQVRDRYGSVDHIRITVDYTDTPSIVGPFPTFFRP